MIVNNSRKLTKVLVYQIGSLGDTIVSIPAYRAIRRHFGSEANIRVLHNAPRDSRAMPHQVLDGSGLVNGSVTFQQYGGRSTWKTWLEVWGKLRKFPADAVVYVAPAERQPSSVQRDKLFFQLCGIPTLLGFHAVDPAMFHARDSAGRPKAIPHESQLRLDRLAKDGIVSEPTEDFAIPLLHLPKTEQENAQVWLEAQGLTQSALIAFCPGAHQPAKFWEMTRLEEIGRRLIAGGMTPLIIGGPIEREIGERLLAAWGHGVNAAGQFSVIGSAALIAQCSLLLGLDTGTTHLAAALGKPCVALYADRDPCGQWEPLGEEHVVLRHPVPCGGCRLDICNVLDHPCMTGITVDQVWAAIKEILNRPIP